MERNQRMPKKRKCKDCKARKECIECKNPKNGKNVNIEKNVISFRKILGGKGREEGKECKE